MVANILVLISGSGTNLQALIDACKAAAAASSSSASATEATTTTTSSSSKPLLPHSRVSHVISNRSTAYGLTRAHTSDPPIPTTTVAIKPFRESHPSAPREAFDADLASKILSLPTDQKPDVIVCAGWMHILSPSFLDPIADADVPIINLHPALPGAFDGAQAIERAYEAFQKGEIEKTGVMVHYVIREVDRGEPIIVKEVEMRKGETLGELTERIHGVEHGALVEGTRKVVEERIKAGKIKP